MSRLRQIGVAAESARAATGRYPDHSFNGRYALPLIAEIESWDYATSIRDATYGDQPAVAATMSVWICPSDDLASLALGHQNFRMCRGSGGRLDGSEGMLPLFVGEEGRKRVADGQSNTALFSERLIPRRYSQHPPWNGPSADIGPLRTVWYATKSHPMTKSGRASFLADCQSAPPEDLPVFPYWSVFWGDQWGYNHTFPPNSKACMNGPPPPGSSHLGPEVANASIPASSRHSGGVNVLFADGRVSLIASQIDADVWKAAGTIDGAEIEDTL